MQKRNKLVNNNDVNKMHYRNEMEKKNFQTQLPNIINNQKVKPNYYKEKRKKKGFSSVYEDEQGNIVLRDNQSIDPEKITHNSPKAPSYVLSGENESLSNINSISKKSIKDIQTVSK